MVGLVMSIKKHQSFKTCVAIIICFILILVGCQTPIPNNQNTSSLTRQLNIQNQTSFLPEAGGYWNGKELTSDDAQRLSDNGFSIKDYPTPTSFNNQTNFLIFKDLNVTTQYFNAKYSKFTPSEI